MRCESLDRKLTKKEARELLLYVDGVGHVDREAIGELARNGLLTRGHERYVMEARYGETYLDWLAANGY